MSIQTLSKIARPPPAAMRRIWAGEVDWSNILDIPDEYLAMRATTYLAWWIQNGFTTIFEPLARRDLPFEMRRALRDGIIPGPRLLVSGPDIVGTGRPECGRSASLLRHQPTNATGVPTEVFTPLCVKASAITLSMVARSESCTDSAPAVDASSSSMLIGRPREATIIETSGIRRRTRRIAYRI
jgi:hypothetical protein